MERNSLQRRSVAALFGLLLAGLLTACGGGGGGSVNQPPVTTPPVVTPPPTGGVDRGGVALGTITGFGSIFVNGVEYETDQAQITVNDAPGSESDLAVGQVVTVTGTVSDDGLTGAAETVIFENDIEGPVQSIDLGAGTVVVVGQTVLINAATVFDDSIVPRSIAGLTVDDFVEVSGFFDAVGRVVASRIERNASGAEVEVKGVVSDLDTATSTFALTALTVDYSAATLEDFGSAGLANGVFVEVKGTTFGAAGELIATRIQAEDDGVGGDDGDAFEIEGFITSFISASAFAVNGLPVVTNAQTVFENGTAASLGVNVKVEVEGSFDTTGALVAGKVQIKLASNLRVEAPVEAIDVSGRRLTVLGLDIRVDQATQFEDESDAGVVFFGLNDLAVGDYVQVRGATDPGQGADILASRVERDDADVEVKLRGFVDSVDALARSLVILGISVVTDSATIDLDAFFSALVTGDLVEVEGRVIGDGVIDARKLEFENAENNDGGSDDDGESEITGTITALTSATEFVVGTQAVRTDTDTEFEHGTAADLAVGVDVKVEGRLDANLVLVAHKVDFETD